MNKKDKKKVTRKKSLSDTTLIRLKKTTLATLKSMKAKFYQDDNITFSYDKIINHGLYCIKHYDKSPIKSN